MYGMISLINRAAQNVCMVLNMTFKQKDATLYVLLANFSLWSTENAKIAVVCARNASNSRINARNVLMINLFTTSNALTCARITKTLILHWNNAKNL